MSNVIQIKRKTSAASAPATLAAGELAYNDHANGKLLYIGIGGPGVEVVGGVGQYSSAYSFLVSQASARATAVVSLASQSSFIGRGATGDIAALGLGADTGLEFTTTNLGIKLASNSGLEFSTGLKINLDGGLSLGAGGISVDTSTIATKAYVDGVAQGLDVHQSVRCATTAAGTLATDFDNGSTIDTTVTLVTGDRILIKNQADPIENGLYIVAVSGAPTRATDLAAGFDGAAGAFCFVEEGTLNGDTGWVCTSNGNADTVNTHALNWSQFSGSGNYTASLGVEKVGNDFRLDLYTNGGIELNGNEVKVKAGTGITLDANGVNIGQAVATTSDVTFGSATLSNLVATTGAVPYQDAAKKLVSEAAFFYTAASDTLTVPVLDGCTIDGGSYA